jgi:uncharacterized membrane protein
MAYLIAVVFDNIDEASQVRETLHKEQRADLITLDDSAIVVRDEDGKIHVKNEVDRGVKIGALWGSLIGILIGGIFLPLGGLALGALGGALIGKLASNSVDKNFIEDVTDSMQPGSSAIFYIFRGDDVAAAVATMRPYKGKILQTTLDPDDEKALRDELKSSIK